MKTLLKALYLLLLAGSASSAAARPIPVEQTIVVEGRYWVQADLFLNLAWNNIAAVCAGGACGAGTLNDYDMDGWTWASMDDVNALFNVYMRAAAVDETDLLVGSDLNFEIDSTWAPAFFVDWRKTIQSRTHWIMVDGMTSSDSGPYGVRARLIDWLPGESDVADSFTPFDKDRPMPGVGGFFFASALPPSSVPTPATPGLLLLAAAYLVWSRHAQRKM